MDMLQVRDILECQEYEKIEMIKRACQINSGNGRVAKPAPVK
jgi:hypothetical protein